MTKEKEKINMHCLKCDLILILKIPYMGIKITE